MILVLNIFLTLLSSVSFGVEKANCGAFFPEKSSQVILNPQSRFVSASLLRQSYVVRDGAPKNSLPYVKIQKVIKDPQTGQDQKIEMELGIVDVQKPEIAIAVSSMLSRSLEDAKDANGGYLPPKIVERVQNELISPEGVANRWGKVGHRFVLSKDAGNGLREIIGSILISKDHDTIFFFTSKFNEVRLSQLDKDVDFNYSSTGISTQKWFDKFDLPENSRYKPVGFHHIANFVVEKESSRGLGLSRLIIDSIVNNYTSFGEKGQSHGQPMLSGIGFWQIGDPPWLQRMGRLGFYPRLGAETFHLAVSWETMQVTKDAQGQSIDNVEYNRRFNVQSMYSTLLNNGDSPYKVLYNQVLNAKKNGLPPPVGDHMVERIPHVLETANSGTAKIQYFQLLYPFSKSQRPPEINDQ